MNASPQLRATLVGGSIAGALDILSRPHPSVVAGTPLGYDFDAEKRTFALKWTTQRASGKGRFGARALTEVRLPRRQYPKGYTVKAAGARVVSRKNAPILVLRARKRQPEVTVSPR